MKKLFIEIVIFGFIACNDAQPDDQKPIPKPKPDTTIIKVDTARIL